VQNSRLRHQNPGADVIALQAQAMRAFLTSAAPVLICGTPVS